MMDTVQDTFLEWLRDAHAAEKQALTMLNAQAERIENYPELRTRIEQHIHETERQIEALDRLLARHDSNASTIKDITGRAMAFAQNMSGMMATDEVVKGALFSFAFEKMEIASYTILITTAERLGDQEAVTVLTGILEEEKAMAKWLHDNLPALTNDYLSRMDLGVDAKR